MRQKLASLSIVAAGKGAVQRCDADGVIAEHKPVNGVGPVERLRQGLSGLRGRGGVALEGSGHQMWIMKQIKTRATSRSW